MWILRLVVGWEYCPRPAVSGTGPRVLPVARSLLGPNRRPIEPLRHTPVPRASPTVFPRSVRVRLAIVADGHVHQLDLSGLGRRLGRLSSEGSGRNAEDGGSENQADGLHGGVPFKFGFYYRS